MFSSTKFEKKLNKYTNKFVNDLQKKSFSQEEELVFSTIAFVSVNSIVYFVEGMREANPSYSGIKPKRWYSELKNISDFEVKSLLIEITVEFLRDGIEQSQDEKKEKYKKWLATFESVSGDVSNNHLVDRVFPYLFLDDAIRNEYPFLTFSEIFSALFERLDEIIEQNLEKINSTHS